MSIHFLRLLQFIDDRIATIKLTDVYMTDVEKETALNELYLIRSALIKLENGVK